MLKKIKAFYNKENFNSSEGMVDPYKYHFTCYFILKFFQVLDNEPKLMWRYFFLIILAIINFLGLFILGLTASYGIKINDLTTIIEAGCYFIILLYQILMYLCTVINLPEYQVFLETLREDFKFICTDGEIYRARYFENQVKIWKMCILSVVFTSFIGIGVVYITVLWLLWYMVTHEPGDGTNPPLLFPFWFFDIDFGKSPQYELAFIFCNLCSLGYAYSYIFMIQTQIFWVGQITTKADLVIWYIQDLMDGAKSPRNKYDTEQFESQIKYRMSIIIREHQSMYRLLENYTKVYKKLLMFEQKVGGIVVCLTAYCSAEKLKDGEINGITMLLCGGTIIEVFIPSYLSTVMGMKLQSVGEACLDIPFWDIGKIIRPYIILIMQRSLRPLQLNAPGFEDVSVQTFSNKMASAYSFFNMLRQTNI
nr:odorant receptor 7 [Papilio dardanus]